MLWINGEWIEGTGPDFASHNPATGAVIWQGRAAGAKQVASAVHAAHRAFPAWAATPFDERLAILTRFRDALEADKAELSHIISEETGKMRFDADSEAAATIGKLALSVAAYQERTPTTARDQPAGRLELTHRPHGVMAVYGPYNFPAHLPNGHIMPALLAGNAVLFKPSEQTPMVAEWMARKWHQSGLPDGVLQLLQGEAETGIELAKQPINGLLFTGSSRTGRLLHQQFAGRPEILLALEMGGNNALIIDEIDDEDAAIHEIILSAFLSSGQRCSCTRRLILIESDANRQLLNRLVAVASHLTVGTYRDDPSPFMGPLINRREADRLLEAQAMWLARGGVSLLPMRALHDTLPLLSPGIVDITAVAERPDEEWFGPLLHVIRVPDLAAAIATANQSAYGLSGGILTRHASAFEQVQRELRAGIINWNKQTTGASGAAPFGGVGQSGNHHPAGYYAADYCAYPVASMCQPELSLPASLPPGLIL